MKKSYVCLVPLLLAFRVVTNDAVAAQGPFALLHSLFDPGTNAQAGANQGRSVAIDGNIAVVGAPYDDAGASASGVVKVYDATTFSLLFTLTNPVPAADDAFGCAVGISGTRVAVGACGDDTGWFEAGSAYVYDLASANPAVPMLTLTNPIPSHDLIGDAFGAAVAISGTRLVVGVARRDVPAPDTGSAYIYDLVGATPAVPSLTLTNPSPAGGDFFGNSVAISGTRVIVGAYQDDAGATDAGLAYVYDLAFSTPTVPVVTLTNPIPALDDRFGTAVAISGTRVIVGTPSHRTATGTWGIAYVFDLVSARPGMPVATLVNPAPMSADNFGASLAISGTRAVIGAYWNGAGTLGPGIAYVYDMSGAAPGMPALTLTNPSPAGLNHFGYSVAISGTRVLIGAPDDDARATDAGSAYLYDLSRSNPTAPRGILNNARPATDDLFGSSVAISGTRVVVGTPADDKGAFNAGSAYVYDLASHTPIAPALVLTNPNPAARDGFGHVVAMSGSQVVVGAPYDDIGAENAGSAHVYNLAGAAPRVPVFTLTNPSPAGNWFGFSAAIAGSRVVVGSPYASIESIQDGGAYVYDVAGTTPAQPVARLTSPSPYRGGGFGYSVAISGTRMVIGASLGGAHVFDLASATPEMAVATLNPASAVADGFGLSVAICGTRIVVGAPYDDTAGYNAGSAYVFDLAGATPNLPVATLTNPNVATGSGFGSVVAIAGTRVVIGFGAGVAYVYDFAGPTPATPVAVLLNPSPAASDYFGSAVAIDGDTVVVGALYDDTNDRNRGAAYIFGLQPALSIAPAAPGFASISWTPATWSGFVLQYTDSFLPANWLNAPSGAANPVTIPTTNASRFYRLFQP